MKKTKRRIAILGGGPSGLLMYKRLVESGRTDIEIEIFERKQQLGAGMPYSAEGANKEHITNVSGNEIPTIVTSIHEWVCTVDKEVLEPYHITPLNFNDYKVLPRLLFGKYLEAQFDLLRDMAREAGIITVLHLGIQITDVFDKPELNKVLVAFEGSGIEAFDHVIICTGHNWPRKHEGKVNGYFDSPYPPAKLELKLNYSVAIRGSSLTAIDAIRTLARNNGYFKETANGLLCFEPAPGSENFKMVMHSRNGLLPAVRFHLEDSHLQNKSLLTPEAIEQHKSANGGFLSLDFIFEKDFKDLFRDKDPEFYARIKDLSLEDFVEDMIYYRENAAPFDLLRLEYAEAEKSIKNHESIYWKELLAVLSFAMNYPAKYFPAEDMLRLQKVLMPLISVVIAFVPQTSCKELLALHDAGRLDIVAVGQDSDVEINDTGGITYHYTDDTGKEHSDYYKMFVDCVGQPHLSFEDFPFKSMPDNGTISRAVLKFQSDDEGSKAQASGNRKVKQNREGYYLEVPGITINDNFEVIRINGKASKRIYIMAVPYIGGFNPDYSGLDFGEEASMHIIRSIQQEMKTQR
ncbi:FAD/NAD(P)-binding protein [Flavobacterium sp. RHBU_24]|uniref:FAD/NAD(P)-binding protein n=1 Tax=Flavobacterium sp. RHBU_24 TaxID=3391185 RepID=UPI0039851AAF